MTVTEINPFKRKLWISTFCLILLAMGPLGAMAQTTPLFKDTRKDHQKYQRCIALSKSNPDAAFDMALTWRDFGGGEAASHCVAAALMGLKIYDEAARRFELLAQISKADSDLRAGLLGHAAQAWLLDGNPNRADSVLTAALKLKTSDPELYIDRAIARADLGNYKNAIKDLTTAIKHDSKRAEAYVFRASAFRHLKQLDNAEKDAEQALRLNAYHLAGLLERGIIRRLKGNKEGARTDWLLLLKLAPNSAAGKSAKANLARMDVKKP